MPVMEMEEVRAARDLWREDKPAFVWATGLALLLVWGLSSLAGGPAWLRPFLIDIGGLGAVVFASGLAVWIAFTPRRRKQFKRPDN